MFTGFPEETIRFFLDLRFHNNSAFFEQNRERYRQEVVAPFSAFIEEIGPAMLKIDPQMELRPYKCMARIRRDTRFSRDKSPYRDHLWVLFRRAGEPRELSVNYWFEFGPGKLGWGLGFWGENRPAMDALRRRMAARPEQMLALIDGCDLPPRHIALGGQSFKRLAVPDNIPERLKPWYLSREPYVQKVFTEVEWAYQPSIAGRVLADYEAMAPLYRLFRGVYEEVMD